MRVETDAIPGLGACAVRWLAKALVDGGTPGVFTYLFGRAAPIEFPPFSPHVSAHAAELAYVFSDNYLFDADADHADEVNLAHNMSAYWGSFAASGIPGARNQVSWPKYDAATDTLLWLDVPANGGVHPRSGLRKDACDFWEAHVTSPA